MTSGGIIVVRGNDAWKMIYEANMFNEEPADDQEYIVAKIHVKNTADLTGKDEPLEISKYDFDLASSNDSISDNQPLIVVPKPELSLTLYEGSEDEGYIAFLVNKSDDNLKTVFVDSFWLLLQ